MDWLQQAPDGPAPAYITEVRYANNETIGTASEPNITVVRKQQEELVRAVYGNDYQNDRELHRALRVVDKMGEGFRQTWLDYVVNRNLDTLRMARDTIQRKETGLSYFTTNFTWFTLVLDIYEPIVGSLPSTRYGIVVEYLRLHFTYPNADEEELLDLFTQSVHQRNDHHNKPVVCTITAHPQTRQPVDNMGCFLKIAINTPSSRSKIISITNLTVRTPCSVTVGAIALVAHIRGTSGGCHCYIQWCNYNMR